MSLEAQITATDWQIEDGLPTKEVFQEFLDHATRWGYCHEMALLDGRITRGAWLTPSKFQPCLEPTAAEDAREAQRNMHSQLMNEGR